MLSSAVRLLALLLALSVQHVTAVDVTRDPALDAQLFTAATQLDRLALIKNNSSWLFDFTQQSPFYNFAPGGVTNMNAATFPAAVDNGMTLAMLNLGPCAMLPPHMHPRATNYVVAIQGNTTTYMFEENGAQLVSEVLTPGKATIFPQGSLHMMVNNGCKNAQLVSALNSNDAGTLNMANVFTAGFPFDLINAAFGSNVASAAMASQVLPPGTGANWGSPSCLQRCGIVPSNTSYYGN